MSRMKKRSVGRCCDSRSWLLDTIPTAKDRIIKDSRLPINKQVLLCFLSHQGSDFNWNQAANATIHQVLSFYRKANIPTIKKLKMMQSVKILVNEMKGLQKYKVERRS